MFQVAGDSLPSPAPTWNISSNISDDSKPPDISTAVDPNIVFCPPTLEAPPAMLAPPATDPAMLMVRTPGRPPICILSPSSTGFTKHKLSVIRSTSSNATVSTASRARFTALLRESVKDSSVTVPDVGGALTSSSLAGVPGREPAM